MELRDYQKECIEKINGLSGGSVLVSMATGLGKTVVFSNVKRRGRVLIISHREELVYQPIKYYDCPCGVEQGENRSNGEEVVSASVQSLIKRLDKFRPDDFDIIITDEAHHSVAPSYKKIYDYFKPRLHIGFTATPNRGDKVRLDDVFSEIIFIRSLKWGIQNNWLSDVKCLRIDVSYDISSVKRRMGDFVNNELDKAVNNTVFNRQVADIYYKYAKGQTLIFASSVSHAENIARQIKGAVVVSQKTENRKDIIDKFTKRQIPCIVNCMIFTEGADIPIIETVIIARPTQNASLYTQMVGRGLRKSPGKDYLTLIDCVGVTEKNEICTAPSLMGLDVGEVPEYRRGMLQGMLTEMAETVEEAMDCPETWILNAKAVDLFANQQGVDLYRINWTKKPDGDLVYQFSCGDRIGIKAIDELGKTTLMRYYYDESQSKFVYAEKDNLTLQQASSLAYDYFSTVYADEKNFWDNGLRAEWHYQPATQKQLDLIASKVPKTDFEHLRGRTLTKHDANQIISMINIRNLKPKDLLRMHRKKEQEKQDDEEKRIAMSLLKIRELIDKKRPYNKYYAIKHPNDLVITNAWDKAVEIISTLTQESEIKPIYKSFLTLTQARDFLRK